MVCSTDRKLGVSHWLKVAPWELIPLSMWLDQEIQKLQKTQGWIKVCTEVVDEIISRTRVYDFWQKNTGYIFQYNRQRFRSQRD